MEERPTKTLLQEGTESLLAAQQALTAQIEFISAKLEKQRARKTADIQLSSHLAFLLEKQTAGTREQRQLEAHAIKAAEAMTPLEADDLVVVYVLDLPIERRRAVMEKLRDADKIRSVL